MIPKIIHYCWFGKQPLPDIALKCIASWRKYLPDYEIQEWNEDNFDVSRIQYTKEAYANRKYAFVSDYARFWILYNYGGVYFDIDVELINSIDDILAKGAFMGYEEDSIISKNQNSTVAPGLGMACESHSSLIALLLSQYESLRFVREDGSYNLTTVVVYTTDLLKQLGLIEKNGIQKVKDFYIYPKEYFCPTSFKSTQTVFTSNTRSIHHYNGSWLPAWKRLCIKIVATMNLYKTIHNLKKCFDQKIAIE